MANNYRDMNEGRYTGRIVSDAQVRNIKTDEGSEMTITSFTIAINSNGTKKNGEQFRKTVFIDCSLWNRGDKLAQYLTKGKMVLVSGETEEPRVGSNGKAYNQLRVSRIQFFQQNYAAQKTEETGAFEVPEAPADDNIPF